ncbi:MAG: tetratricopeptide repeat protein [Treponema sp.]|nr:tetratricopeptide repeat protein [Treponema sp.]
MKFQRPSVPADPPGFVPGRLCHIVIPASLAGDFSSFTALDPLLPLPVELPPGEETLNPETLKPEMVFSGILKCLAEDPQGEHSGYYRNLVNAVRPGIAGELLETALLKSRNGDYGTALEILDLLDGLCPRQPSLFLYRAMVLESRARALERIAAPGGDGASPAERALTEAEEAYERALAFPDPEMKALFYAGRFYGSLENYRRGADCLRAYLAAGDAGDEDLRREAEDMLEEIRKDGLEDEDLEEAAGLIRRGSEELGILKAREFLERCPGAGKGWFILGWGLRRLSRWQDGAACFEKALELVLSGADLRNELAICRMELGDLPGAGEELKRALGLDPDNVKIISNLGVLALKRGDRAGAASFFRTVLELEPEDPLAAAFFSQPDR